MTETEDKNQNQNEIAPEELKRMWDAGKIVDIIPGTPLAVIKQIGTDEDGTPQNDMHIIFMVRLHDHGEGNNILIDPDGLLSQKDLDDINGMIQERMRQAQAARMGKSPGGIIIPG